jgi:hypothetical protein
MNDLVCPLPTRFITKALQKKENEWCEEGDLNPKKRRE